MIEPPEGMTRIDEVNTGINISTGLVVIEFIEDGEVAFCAMIDPAELDRFIGQLQEQRSIMGPRQ